MHTVLKVLGILFLGLATSLGALLVWLATKGLLTTKGLILDLPAQGRIFPVSVGALITIVLLIVILGLVTLTLGKRTPTNEVLRKIEHELDLSEPA
ncbi:MAG TPA: hypothetical protein VN943_03035 [Candidatus Acidoferrum sp.]|nr:hypothetical protein [Candidatus Acidoferrum sp.]